MTIEEKLDLLRVALENGADIDVWFHRRKSEEDAKQVISLFPNATTEPTTLDIRTGKFEAYDDGIEFRAFYKLKGGES